MSIANLSLYGPKTPPSLDPEDEPPSQRRRLEAQPRIPDSVMQCYIDAVLDAPPPRPATVADSGGMLPDHAPWTVPGLGGVYAIGQCMLFQCAERDPGGRRYTPKRPLPDDEIIVQRKYDGWRTTIRVRAGGKVDAPRTRTGSDSFANPHVMSLLEKQLGGFPPGRLDCEAIWAVAADRRDGGNEAVAAAWRSSEPFPPPGSERLLFVAFDWLEESTGLDVPLRDRLRRLSELLLAAEVLPVLSCPVADRWTASTTPAEVKKLLTQMKEQKWEGILLKRALAVHPPPFADGQRASRNDIVKVRPDMFGPMLKAVPYAETSMKRRGFGGSFVREYAVAVHTPEGRYVHIGKVAAYGEVRRVLAEERDGQADDMAAQDMAAWREVMELPAGEAVSQWRFRPIATPLAVYVSADYRLPRVGTLRFGRAYEIAPKSDSLMDVSEKTVANRAILNMMWPAYRPESSSRAYGVIGARPNISSVTDIVILGHVFTFMRDKWIPNMQRMLNEKWPGSRIFTTADPPTADWATDKKRSRVFCIPETEENKSVLFPFMAVNSGGFPDVPPRWLGKPVPIPVLEGVTIIQPCMYSLNVVRGTIEGLPIMTLLEHVNRSTGAP